MKPFIIGLAMSSLLFIACNNNKKSTANTDSDSKQVKTTEAQDTNGPLEKVIQGYLQLKNALVNENDKDASAAGKSIVNAITGVNAKLLSKKQSDIFKEVADDIKEHAEHISANAGNIKHQREHFETLSQEVYELVKAGGPIGQKLYYDYCPMYSNEKGGNWLSENKDIRNPYMGKSMLTCGSIKEELN